MGSDSGRDRPVIEVTSAMIEAGKKAFMEWFERGEHAQSLVELPSSDSVASLLIASFASMAAVMPASRIN